MYNVEYTKRAEDGLKKLRKSEPNAFKKAMDLLVEIMEHPTTGTGKPERLSGDRAGQWSRRITDKHRLVYTINDTTITVLVLTTYGHYDGK